MGKVHRCFLVLHKRAVEHRALMTAVGRDHSESARKGRRVPGGLSAQRRPDRSVQAATPLIHKPAIPAIWKSDSKADCIVFAVAPDALVDNALRPAIRRDFNAHGFGIRRPHLHGSGRRFRHDVGLFD
jgi:hypothetical protein